MKYLAETGLGDVAYFGPENEFFIFDDVKIRDDINCSYYEVDSEEGAWNSAKNYVNIIDGFKNDPNNKIKSAFSEAGNVLSQVKDVAGDTIGLAGSIVDAGEGWKDNVNAKYQKLSTDATNLGKQVDNILKTLGQTARGTATFTIDYGSIFKACHNKSNVDWILNDWSMKPSMNFINIGNKAKPIYIDFTVNFETNCILSERDLANIIQ